MCFLDEHLTGTLAAGQLRGSLYVEEFHGLRQLSRIYYEGRQDSLAHIATYWLFPDV